MTGVVVALWPLWVYLVVGAGVVWACERSEVRYLDWRFPSQGPHRQSAFTWAFLPLWPVVLVGHLAWVRTRGRRGR